ncbi:MAG: DUF4143 domain-containing protein [Bifidobacteriaceae bacterium]|jgi:predicted AAA+ superfamily ATPase|nr:DUF4143 domain-containing protein [Bifidobacteriaceae bacterium]
MPSDPIIPRFALAAAEAALADTPVVAIQGARQVGKSTLVQTIANSRNATVVTLDDPLTRAVALEDPNAVIGLGTGGLLAIDEAQRAPGLILPLKANVDANHQPGRFLLTGSSDLLRLKGVGDSLAGRAETISLMPFSQGELTRRETPEDFVTWLLSDPTHGRLFPALEPEAVVKGGFPPACARSETRAKKWLREYAIRLAGHDAAELQERGYPDQLGAMLQYLAAAGHAELVKAHLARHLGVAESTVAIYWRLLKAMHLVQEYPAWNRAPLRRLAHRPKACLLDTGLAAALTGFTSSQAKTPGGREFYGNLVEQFVALELTKQSAWSRTPHGVFHYRELDGLEADLFLETDDGHLIAIEVKATTTPIPKHWKNLIAIKERLPERQVTGVLLHTGSSSARLHGWLHVLPVTSLWHHDV